MKNITTDKNTLFNIKIEKSEVALFSAPNQYI